MCHLVAHTARHTEVKTVFLSKKSYETLLSKLWCRPTLWRLASLIVKADIASEHRNGSDSSSNLNKNDERNMTREGGNPHPMRDVGHRPSTRAGTTQLPQGSPSARIHQRHSTSSDTRPRNSANFPHCSPRHIRKCLSKRLAPDKLPGATGRHILGTLGSTSYIPSPRRGGSVTSALQRAATSPPNTASMCEQSFLTGHRAAGDNLPPICAAVPFPRRVGMASVCNL